MNYGDNIRDRTGEELGVKEWECGFDKNTLSTCSKFSNKKTR